MVNCAELDLNTPSGRLGLVEMLGTERVRIKTQFSDSRRSPSHQYFDDRIYGNVQEVLLSGNGSPEELFRAAIEARRMQKATCFDIPERKKLSETADTLFRQAAKSYAGTLESRKDLYCSLLEQQCKCDKGTPKYDAIDEARKLVLGSTVDYTLNSMQLIRLLKIEGITLSLSEMEAAQSLYRSMVGMATRD